MRPPLLTMRCKNACSSNCGTGFLVLEALHPVLGVLAEEHLECCQQPAHPQCAGGVDVPCRVLVNRHFLGSVDEGARDHLSVDRVGDADGTVLRHQTEIAYVLQIVV